MSKFIKSLARHELAVTGLAAATSRISEALDGCPVQAELANAIVQQWNGGGCSTVEALTDDNGRTKTHLWRALNTGDRRRYDDEVTEYLADEETGCPHCAKAWELIHERKKARKELGVARGLIRAFGRQAVKLVEAEQ